MSQLAFLHLALQSDLTRLPSFDGLTNLKYAMLACLFAVVKFPSFDSLKNLKHLELTCFPLLTSLPDLAPLHKLEYFAVGPWIPVCCNGFLGACNETHPYCVAYPSIGTPQASCITDESKRASAATRLIVAKHSVSICHADVPLGSEKITEETAGMCAGKPFKQCQVPTFPGDPTAALKTGICVNTRMQVLACSMNPLMIQTRKLQIERRVGPPCDPAVESWLGCA